MKIALTGTPGTGKTAAAGELEKMGYRVLHVHDLVETFTIGYDEKRESNIIDEDALARYVQEIDDPQLIIEGHVSHLLGCDAAMVLRCHPEELQKRLKNKHWKEEKIRENVEAEALDIILERALERHEKVWEIDTTGKRETEVAEEIAGIIETMPPPHYGEIDWSEWLMEHAG